MSRFAFAHPLKNLTAMARFPSHRAPRAQDVLQSSFHPPQIPTLSDEERQLLEAVIARPDDDPPRRVLADWYGGERGGFIHAQLDGQTPHPDPAWASIFEPWCARDLVYRRGFVEGISLAGRSFLSLGEPLFHMTPLREVRLVAIAPFAGELCRCELIRRLKTLDLRGNHLDEVAIQTLRRQFPITDIQA